jgi:hypothetical protein
MTDREEYLRQEYGQVWNTEQLQIDFEVIGFMAPWVKVKRRSDGVEGTLLFDHYPRLYFSFIDKDGNKVGSTSN